MIPELFCPSCEDYREARYLSDYESYVIEGRGIIVMLGHWRCRSCGEELGSDKSDQALIEALKAFDKALTAIERDEQE